MSVPASPSDKFNSLAGTLLCILSDNALLSGFDGAFFVGQQIVVQSFAPYLYH
jgi:hypothetical protein